ncbi:5459_t:CDS:2, partial [Ambispora gerdemannii]
MSHNFSQDFYKRIVVFGDSYSDTNNVYKLTGGEWPAPQYCKGRFSDGPVWSEYVAKDLNLELVNYAYGGATSDSIRQCLKVVIYLVGYSGKKCDVLVPGMLQQVSQFLKDFSSKTNFDNTLVVTWLVFNDYGFSNFTANPKKVVSRVALSWKNLYENGVRNFLIPNIPDFTYYPVFRTESVAHIARLKTIVRKHNDALQNAIQKFRYDYPDAVVHTFAADQFFNYYRTIEAKFRRVVYTKEEKEEYDNCAKLCVSVEDMCRHRRTRSRRRNSLQKSVFYIDDYHPATNVHFAFAAGITETLLDYFMY